MDPKEDARKKALDDLKRQQALQELKSKQATPVTPEDEERIKQLSAANFAGDNGVSIAETVLGNVNKPFVNAFSGIPKTLATVSENTVGKIPGLATEGGVQNSPLYQAGDWLTKKAEEWFPTNPAVEKEFPILTKTAPETLGTLLAFAMGGKAGTTTRVAELAIPSAQKAVIQSASQHIPAVFMASAGSASAAYDAAKASGADDDVALEAFVKTLPSGLPFLVTPTFKVFNNVTGGALKYGLAQAAQGGLTGMFQMGYMKAIENAAAQDTYDKTRSLVDGVLATGGSGFTINALITGVVSALTRKAAMSTVDRPIIEKAKAYAESKLKETETHDNLDFIKKPVEKDGITDDLAPETAVQIDSQANEIKDAIANLSERMAKGEQPSTPEDLQLYENNKAVVEDQLKMFKERDEAKAEYTKRLAEWENDPTDESYAKVQEAAQNYKSKVEPIAASKKNPYEARIRDLEKDNDPESFMSKARTMLAEFPDKWVSLTAKLMSTEAKPGKQNRNDFFKALRDAANIPRKVVTNEMTLLKDQIKNFARGIRQGRLDEKKDRVNMIGTIKDIIGKQSLPEKTHKAILNKLEKIDFKNTDKVIAFAEFAEKASKDAAYAERIKAIEDAKERVRSKYKKGIPEKQHRSVEALLNIDPARLNDPAEYEAVINQMANNLHSPTNEAYQAPVSTKTMDEVSGKAKTELDLKKARSVQQELLDTLDDMDQQYQEIDPSKPQEEKDAEHRAKLHELVDDIKTRLPKPRAGFEETHSALSDVPKEVLDQLSLDEMKEYVKKLDQISVNDDYSGTADIASKIDLIKNKEKIPVMDRKIGIISETGSTLATGLNWLYNQSKKLAAQFRTHTGLQDELDGNVKANVAHHNMVKEIQNLKNDIEYGSNWKKIYSKVLDVIPGYTSKIDLTSPENKRLSAIYAEFNSRLEHLTWEQAFYNTRVNIETTIANLIKTGSEEAAITQKAYEMFASAKNIEDVRAIMAKKNPAVKRWVEGLQDIWKKSGIEEKSYRTLEVVDGERPPKVEGYLPLGTRVINGLSLDNDLVARRTSLLGSVEDASNLQKRNEVMGKSALRTGDFLNDIILASKEVLEYAETAEPRVKLSNFQKLNSKEGYKWTGGTEKDALHFFKFLKDKVAEPQKPSSTRMGVTVNSVLNTISRAAYTFFLAGPTQILNQYIPGLTRVNSDLIARGDMDLFINNGANTPAAKKVRSEHTIGGRFDYYSGLTTSIETEGALKVDKTHIDRSLGYLTKNLANVDELVTYISNKAVRSMFGKADANLAERSWTAMYLSYLKSKGVDVSKSNKNSFWENEVANKRTELRRQAAAYAESYIGENLQHSTGMESFALQKRLPNIIRMTFPLMGYSINRADAISKSAITMITSKIGSQAQKDAAGNLSGHLIEAAALIGVKTLLAYNIKDYLAELWRNNMTSLESPEADDEEKRKAIRFRRLIWDNVKNNAIGPVGVATNPLWDDNAVEHLNQFIYDYNKEEDESFTDFVERTGGKPIPSFGGQEIGEMGLWGAFGKMTGGDKDWYVDGVDLVWKDQSGNTHRKELTDEEASAFYSPLLKFGAGIMGPEFLNAIESSERQAVREAKQRKND